MLNYRAMTSLGLLMFALTPAARADAQALDYIRGTNNQSYNGKIQQLTPNEVTFQQGGQEKKLPVSDILLINFHGEPTELRSARADVIAGRYEQAAESLAKVDAVKIKENLVQQDLAFYRAVAVGRPASFGEGDVIEAGKLLFKFVQENKDSWHFFEANELLGDVLMVRSRFEQAVPFYRAVAASTVPMIHRRGQIALGRALAALGKWNDAKAAFEEALVSDAGGKQEENLTLLATIGKAETIAQLGDVNEAVGLLKGTIQQTRDEQVEINAWAYKVLGDCYLKLNNPQKALLAYLEVDLLYDKAPVPHAEALRKIADLWTKREKPDRAKAAHDKLKSLYPSSRFAQ